ncbi:MAG: DUF5655 domain-containing protein [Gemmatimonadota bacterium]
MSGDGGGKPLRPLWTCPKCGHSFVTRNLWHSCSRYPLEFHFEGKDPVVRATFDRFLEAIQACGPVTVIPQKTRIAIQARVRFAGGVTRKKWLNAALWLTRRPEHLRITRIETFGPRSFGVRFKLERPEDVDDALVALIREAYDVGCQRHLQR